MTHRYRLNGQEMFIFFFREYDYSDNCTIMTNELEAIAINVHVYPNEMAALTQVSLC
jgi:hypothetical protein